MRQAWWGVVAEESAFERTCMSVRVLVCVSTKVGVEATKNEEMWGGLRSGEPGVGDGGGRGVG